MRAHRRAPDRQPGRGDAPGVREQLHREYRIDYEDTARDFGVPCESLDAAKNRRSLHKRSVSLAVFEKGKPRDVSNAIRVAVIEPSAEADTAAVELLDDILCNLPDQRPEASGVWTNGREMSFRMRVYDRAGNPRYLIFCEIHDEWQSRRKLFIGATEGGAPDGQKAVSGRVAELFEEVKVGENSPYRDVFAG